MTRLVIVTQDPSGYAHTRYALRVLQQRWEEQGFEIRVIAKPGADDEADLAILHVDATWVPDELSRQLQHYPRVINGRATDISKRSFSAQLLRRDDAYEGPVIVKTDANFGGIEDYRADINTPVLTVGSASTQPPWKRVKYLDPNNYPVFDSIRAVPPGVWANPRLIVEKFLAERDGDLYCLRSWVFLGNREMGLLARSAHPIVKSHNTVSTEKINEFPDELRQWRTRLGFDYGKFDYAIVAGQVVLYDANRTPTAAAKITEKSAAKLRDGLCDGIYDFL